MAQPLDRAPDVGPPLDHTTCDVPRAPCAQVVKKMQTTGHVSQSTFRTPIEFELGFKGIRLPLGGGPLTHLQPPRSEASRTQKKIKLVRAKVDETAAVLREIAQLHEQERLKALAAKRQTSDSKNNSRKKSSGPAPGFGNKNVTVDISKCAKTGKTDYGDLQQIG